MTRYPEESCRFTDSRGTTFDYDVIEHIGSGSFSSVFEVSMSVSDDVPGYGSFAMKKVRHPDHSVAFLESVSEKLHRIRFIESPNVTQYLHVRAEEINDGCKITVQTTVIMDYCKFGNLDSYAESAKLSDGQIEDFIQQILRGLVAIHSHKVVHMDLNTSNIVLTHDKISRYGLTAKITGLDGHFPLSLSKERPVGVASGNGTLLFMSPEMMVNGTKGFNIGRKADIWSMGCIVVDLYRKRKAFRFVKTVHEKLGLVDMLVIDLTTRPEAITSFVIDGGVPKVPIDIPDTIRSITQKCFQMNPKERPDAAEMLRCCLDESVCYPGGLRTQEQEFVLKNQEFVPKREGDDRDLSWDGNLNCAARVLVHHMPDTHFPYQNYETEIAHARNDGIPAQIIDNKRTEFIQKSLTMKRTAGPYSFITQAAGSKNKFIFEAPAHQLSASLSGLFPTVEVQFCDINIWMNKYTTEYQYVWKRQASWSDIKPLIDRHEPVIAHLCIGDKRVKTAGKPDIGSSWPKMRSNAVVLHGYKGETADGEPHTVTYTDSNGRTQCIPYKKFKRYANYSALHPLTREALDCSPAQIIYRVKKGSQRCATWQWRA